MLKQIDFITPRIHAWRKIWRENINSPSAKFSAYLDMLIFDHGLFRLLYANRVEIDVGVERANHPLPSGIKAAAKRGIKTIINLRGPNEFGSYALEKQACAQYHLTLIDFRVFSRELPAKEVIFGAKELFERVEYPILMHCKSGADRAGLMAALYFLAYKQAPVEQALRQLSWRYGHIRQAKTGILDCFVEAYRDFNGHTPTPFLQWVEQHYDHQALYQQCTSKRWANALVDKVLRRE